MTHLWISKLILSLTIQFTRYHSNQHRKKNLNGTQFRNDLLLIWRTFQVQCKKVSWILNKIWLWHFGWKLFTCLPKTRTADIELLYIFVPQTIIGLYIDNNFITSPQTCCWSMDSDNFPINFIITMNEWTLSYKTNITCIKEVIIRCLKYILFCVVCVKYIIFLSNFISNSF